ncbi:MAG: NADH:ubiquinone reductase (Na(+)-transporting) subunit F [Verrucomicrobia bacterium A1]|nr:MAG: NADH:ubiquinone reductase (Na(+)-transporting) subunit F [Verrucomicrobia bacterium A1]
MENQFAFVLTSVVVFTGLILILVAGLNFASRRLQPSGPVRIDINDGHKDLTVDSGSSLLTALAAQKIYLPSACGGGGTCAMCKCVVTEGGGDILPTETGHINRHMAKQGWRLACQLKVKRDLKIRVPEDVLEIKKFEGTVRSNRNVATFIKEFIVDLPPGMNLNFKAGGYIQIDIPTYKDLPFRSFDIDERFRDAWDRFKLWDLKTTNAEPIFRAYSMANHPAEGNMVMLNVRIATPPPGIADAQPGLASSYIFSLKPGDKVVLSGPFGEFFPKETKREMVYIGGGAGMAPMRSHVFDLFRTRGTDRKVSFWYGARSRREMFYDEDFKAIGRDFPNFRYTVALSEPQPEDKWDGATGFIHKAVHDLYLKNHPDPAEVEYYLCGPPMMIAAVNRMLFDLGVEKDMIAYDEFG